MENIVIKTEPEEYDSDSQEVDSVPFPETIIPDIETDSNSWEVDIAKIKTEFDPENIKTEIEDSSLEIKNKIEDSSLEIKTEIDYSSLEENRELSNDYCLESDQPAVKVDSDYKNLTQVSKRGRTKKQSHEGRLLKKRLAENSRRERIKQDPDRYLEEKNKRHIKYINLKKRGIIKPVKKMSESEKEAQRERWRENSSRYREKRGRAKKQSHEPKKRGRTKKQSHEELLLKKRLAENRRRERIKQDPDRNLEEKNKRHIKYINLKKKGIIKPVKKMSESEKGAQRERWRENSSRYRENNRKKKNNL